MNERYTKSLNMTIPIASSSLILDAGIFILPLIAVIQLQLTLRKKLGVIAVFTAGFVYVYYILLYDFDILTIFAILGHVSTLHLVSIQA